MHPDRGRARGIAGFFLTLEGPEGSGKSTQAVRLAARLEAAGRQCVVTREPGGTQLGEEIRRILLHSAELSPSPAADALLFNAARAQLVDEVIRPSLDRGAVVICDRFAESTLAYQGYGAGESLDTLRALARVATGGLGPDLTLLIDLPVEDGLRRKQGDEVTRFEKVEDVSFHQRVRGGFLELARLEPARFVVIDGRQSLDAIEAAIFAAVAPRLGIEDGVTASTTRRSGEPEGPAVSEPNAGSLRMDR